MNSFSRKYATAKLFKPRIQTNRELNGRDPEPGYEWDAGVFFPRAGHPFGGRITARLTNTNWEVVEVTFQPVLGKEDQKMTRILASFDLGEENERLAKTRAREIYNEIVGHPS